MVKMFDVVMTCINEKSIFRLGGRFILRKKLIFFTHLFNQARKIQHIIWWVSQLLLLSFLKKRKSSFISLCMVPKTIKAAFINWKNKLIISRPNLVTEHFIHWTFFINTSLCFNCAESLYGKFLHRFFNKRFNFSLNFTKNELSYKTN